MSVHKDKNRGTWFFVVRVHGKQYKRRSNEWTLKRHAVQAEVDFLANLEFELTEGNDMTFKELADKYVEYVKLHRKATTVNNIQRVLKKHINPFFGKMKIKNITLYDIERFQRVILDKEYIKDGKPRKYSNYYLSDMQSITRATFDYATKHRLLNYNPFLQVETVQRKELEVPQEITIITHDEFKKFLSAINDIDAKNKQQVITDRALFNVLYWCGLRIGEALALNIEDVDLKKKTLLINKTYDSHNQVITTTKTGNNRIVDIPDSCLNYLIELLDLYKEYEHEVSFPLFGLTQRYSKTSLDRRKNKYIEDSNSRYFTFHELRHTHVSTLIQIGMRDIDIAKRLGHGVEMVNETYGHLFPSDKENMMNKLNNL